MKILGLVSWRSSKNLYKVANTSGIMADSKLSLDLVIIKKNMETRGINEFGQVKGIKMLADCWARKGASARVILKVMRTGRTK